MRKGGRIPTSCCARCGAPEPKTLRTKFSWHHPAIFLVPLLIFIPSINPFVKVLALPTSFIGGFIMTKSGASIRLRGRCRRRQALVISVGLAILFGGAALAASLMERGIEATSFWIFELAFIGAAIAIRGRKTLPLKEITATEMKFKGIPKSLLEPRTTKTESSH